MATHKLQYYFEVEFDDNTKMEIPISDERVSYFFQQKSKYLIRWLENFIEENHITAKPLFIVEKFKVSECEPYDNIIGI